MAMETVNAIELPPDYYLANFLSLVEFVAGRYWQLLSETEQEFYTRFKAAPADAQKLYVRLLSRKGPLFRHGKLDYAEIGCLRTAAAALSRAGLLAVNPQAEVQQLLGLFSKAELLTRCTSPADRKPLRALGREQLELALQQYLPGDELCARLLRGETVYQLNRGDAFTTFQLCYFGNLRQSLTDYVLRDLGLQRYEHYSLEQRYLLFQSRAQIDRHLHYYRCHEQLPDVLLQDAAALLAFYAGLPHRDAADKTLTRRLERLILALARQLERLGALAEADRLYAECRQPPARERRARIALKRDGPAAALAVCRHILAEPGTEQEHHFALQFGHRLAARQQLDWPAPARYRPPEDVVTLGREHHRVELAAAQYLSRHCDCFYVENTLFNGVLGLFIWDIVFADRPGVFFNPFQSAPADFYQPEFVAARQPLLQRRLQELCEPRFGAIVKSTFQRKRGIANPLVAWQHLSEELLELALRHIPLSHWRCVFRRQLADLRHHCSGLPDLIAFPASGGYELVEVKGPSDRLQKNQLRWMHYFARHHISHRVLMVEWADSA